MADVVLFHHVQGLTDGVRAFAEQLRGGEHTVHTPDLFDGQRPATVDDGIALVRSIGEQVLSERADQVAAGLPEGLVYAGRSGRGPTGSRCRSTGWTRTRSSRWKATSTRPRVGRDGRARAGHAVRVPGRPAPVRRQLAAVVR